MVKYKKSLEEFQNQENYNYHKLSTQRANDFLINFIGVGSNSVDTLLDKNKWKIIEINNKRLVPIIKSILFCARNNIPLHGHYEIGSMASDDTINSCLNGE